MTRIVLGLAFVLSVWSLLAIKPFVNAGEMIVPDWFIGDTQPALKTDPFAIPASEISTQNQPSTIEKPVFRDNREKLAWEMGADPSTHVWVEDPRDVPQKLKYSTWLSKENIKEATKIAINHGLEPQAFLTTLWDESVFGKNSQGGWKWNIGHYNMGREDYPEGTSPKKLHNERYGEWIDSPQYLRFLNDVKNLPDEDPTRVKELEQKYMTDWFLNSSASHMAKMFKKHGPYTLDAWHYYSGYGEKAYGGQNLPSDAMFFGEKQKNLNFRESKPQGKRKMGLYPGIKENLEIDAVVNEAIEEMNR